MLTAANVHGSPVFEVLVDAIASVKGKRGRSRKRPEKLHADKGYDYPRYRQFLRKLGIKVRVAWRRVESSQRLGRWRWVVGRTFRGWPRTVDWWCAMSARLTSTKPSTNWHIYTPALNSYRINSEMRS